MIITDITAGTTSEFTFLKSEIIDAVPHLYLSGAGHYHATGTFENDVYKIRIAPDISGEWIAGNYLYSLSLKTETDVFEIERGNLIIKPNLYIQGDYRSDDEKILANINAVLAGTATFDQQSYKIQNREMHRIPRAELLKMKFDIERRISATKSAEKAKNTGVSNLKIRQIPIRFVRGIC